MDKDLLRDRLYYVQGEENSFQFDFLLTFQQGISCCVCIFIYLFSSQIAQNIFL